MRTSSGSRLSQGWEEVWRQPPLLMVLSVPRGANLPSQNPAASEVKPPSHCTHLRVSALLGRSAQARPARELCRRGKRAPSRGLISPESHCGVIALAHPICVTL